MRLKLLSCGLLWSTFLFAREKIDEDHLKKALLEATLHADAARQLQVLTELNRLYELQHELPQQAGILDNIVAFWSTHIDPNCLGSARYKVDLAEVENKLGNMKEAERNARFGIGILDKSGPLYAAATTHADRVLESILRAEGKADEADQLLASLPALPAKHKGAQAPILRSTQEPEYSVEATNRRLSGTVKLSLVVDKSGRAAEVAVTSPLGFGLDQSAVKTVRRWKFSPGKLNGEPIDTPAVAEINFKFSTSP